ncbi:hypothetical protein SeMB42_g01078 [Synchytrium endobioticum]|uniref:Uncharacterized protein n=1 Tax=Synchytrium endobioticum TaxID=286115 RepID=A0A507D460_9FUNG|nr:hypothetical protein SeLEV6574_g03424 [Synchytrium endobioticum]TPX52966.1 hypothetical protein SeMB42_g01078 [Synchytrium endobioticum]
MHNPATATTASLSAQEGILSPSPRRLAAPSRLDSAPQDASSPTHVAKGAHMRKKSGNATSTMRTMYYNVEQLPPTDAEYDTVPPRTIQTSRPASSVGSPAPRCATPQLPRSEPHTDSHPASEYDEDELPATHHRDDFVNAVFELHQIASGIPLINTRRPSVSEGFIASASPLSHILVDSRQEAHYGNWQQRILNDVSAPARIIV